MLLDEAQGRELADDSTIDRGLGVEVEVLEGFAGGKVGEAFS